MLDKFRLRVRRPSGYELLAISLGIAALGSLAYGAIPAADGTLRGCYQRTNGNLRLVDEGEACRSYEKLVTWNQKGQPGAPGVSGYEVVTATAPGTPSGTGTGEGFAEATATCPPGKKVLGGAYHGDFDPVFSPELDGASSQILSDNTQFRVNANDIALGQGGRLVVQATCANVP